MPTALTLTVVRGPIETPLGEKPAHGRFYMALRAADREGSTTIAPVLIEIALDADGDFSRAVWANQAGEVGLPYAAWVTWWSAIENRQKTAALGYVSVPTVGTPDLADLWTGEAPDFVPAEILAVMQGLLAQTQALAGAAAGSAAAAAQDRIQTGLDAAAAQLAAVQAALYDPTFRFSDVPNLLASTRTAGGEGVVWQAGPYLYREATPTATDHDVTNAVGVKLYVMLTSSGELPADAFGIGTVDDSVPMAAAFAAQARRLRTPQPVINGTTANTVPWLAFSQRQYYWATPITLPSHCFVKGNGCIFAGPAGGRLFNGSLNGYHWIMEDVTWAGDDIEAIFADMNNLNNARFLFRRNVFANRVHTLDRFAIRIKSTSSQVILEDCRVSVCPNVLETDVDFTHISKGWYQAWISLPGIGTAAPTGARFKFSGRFVHFSHGVAIPEPDGSTRQAGARWIDRVGNTRIYMEDWHFGAENAGLPIIYNFQNASYDSATSRQTSILTFKDSQLACGSASRPDAGVIVLQNGVLPGWVDMQNCESLGLAPVISAHGYDPTGDATTQNAALLAALLAAPANRFDMQLSINDPFKSRVPDALRGYVRQVEGRKLKAYISPEAGVAIPAVDGLKLQPNDSGARSHDTFFVRVSVNCGMPSSRTLYQEKVFKVTILSNGTGNLFSNVAVDDFFEWARFGAPDNVGDVLITLAQRSGASGTLIGFDVSLAASVVSSYQSMQVEVFGNIRSSAATGTRALLPCLV
ncbi:hypothetical protein [Pseudotabrizicola sp. 4114]|uniref:hypothetical protein n=1 Tax=Pseudotabrizicola sp. 4114 TaxID=2817731 RepID=UPI00285F6F6B|nr:hypothetical protein [Pseudorhodobacter sp. 4114]